MEKGKILWLYKYVVSRPTVKQGEGSFIIRVK